jgi:hypothetical protein
MRKFLDNKTAAGVLLLLSALVMASAAHAQVLGRDGLPILGPEKATDGSSNCFYSNGGLGCDDAVCEATVCAIDSFCCDVAWDGICASEAIQLCEVTEVDNGERAVFHVSKNYVDGNTASATVTLSCFTGLPLVQSQLISNTQDVAFVVQSYNDGELDCDVSENPVPAGYSASYIASGNGSDDDEGCHFEDLALGANLFCEVTNIPDPVTVTVNKNWVIEGNGGDQLNPAYELTLWCDNAIEGGTPCQDISKAGGYDECYNAGPDDWYKVLTESGTGNTNDADYTADVVPYWDGGTDCWVEEQVYDDSVEVDGYDCGYSGNPGVHIVVGGGGGENECTITNTVFYEGIPTLGQYSMAILALMMLGLGMIGFRRFAA